MDEALEDLDRPARRPFACAGRRHAGFSRWLRHDGAPLGEAWSLIGAVRPRCETRRLTQRLHPDSRRLPARLRPDLLDLGLQAPQRLLDPGIAPSLASGVKISQLLANGSQLALALDHGPREALGNRVQQLQSPVSIGYLTVALPEVVSNAGKRALAFVQTRFSCGDCRLYLPPTVAER